MAKLTKAELARADEVVLKNREAANQIEQAGRGLHVAIQACLAGTSTFDTVSVLAACIAYVTDAQRVLIEIHNKGAAAPAERRIITG